MTVAPECLTRALARVRLPPHLSGRTVTWGIPDLIWRLAPHATRAQGQAAVLPVFQALRQIEAQGLPIDVDGLLSYVITSTWQFDGCPRIYRVRFFNVRGIDPRRDYELQMGRPAPAHWQVAQG